MYLLPILALVIGGVALAIHLIEAFDAHAHQAGIAHQAVDASLKAAENAPTPQAAAQHIATAVVTQTTIAMPKAAAAHAAVQKIAPPPGDLTPDAPGWKAALRQHALAAATVALTDATNDAIAASINLMQHPGDALALAKLDGARQLQERARESIRKLGGGAAIDVMTPESSEWISDTLDNIPDAAAAFAMQAQRLMGTV